MTYGVVPTGFARKPLAVILAEVEAQLITEFGPDLVQTAASPMGQINGLFADMLAELWEFAEDVYQSYDPNQAEGSRLDILGNIRLLRRVSGESDAQYRRSITNDGLARLSYADFTRALKNTNGVTFAQVFVNEGYEINENSMPPNTIAAAVLGGDDTELAYTINKYATPGISMHGNTAIDTNIDGYCRTIRMVRPFEIATRLVVRVNISKVSQGCPAPSPNAMAAALLAHLTDPVTRPINGQTIDAYVIRRFLESTFENVEYISLSGWRLSQPDVSHAKLTYDFFEIADVVDVAVEVV